MKAENIKIGKAPQTQKYYLGIYRENQSLWWSTYKGLMTKKEDVLEGFEFQEPNYDCHILEFDLPIKI